MTTEIKSKPRDRIEQRESDILNAASRLFAQHDFNATSTKKIASKAGVSEGTLFHYFNTKNELLSAILAKMYADLTLTTNEGIQGLQDTRQRLYFLAENHVAKTSADNALLLRLIYVYINLDINIFEHLETTDLYKLNHTYTKIFDSVIKDGMHRGELRPDINLSAVRDLFYGGLEYAIRTLMLRNKMDDVSDYVYDIVEPLWQSLCVKESTRSSTEVHSLEGRLEKACLRIEKLAQKMT